MRGLNPDHEEIPAALDAMGKASWEFYTEHVYDSSEAPPLTWEKLHADDKLLWVEMMVTGVDAALNLAEEEDVLR